MACFNTIHTKGVLRNTIGNRAFFSVEELSLYEMVKAVEAGSDDVLMVHFYAPNTPRISDYYRELSGISLLKFQKWLEARGGSILVPITQTRHAYVSIEGQEDADEDE